MNDTIICEPNQWGICTLGMEGKYYNSVKNKPMYKYIGEMYSENNNSYKV